MKKSKYILILMNLLPIIFILLLFTKTCYKISLISKKLKNHVFVDIAFHCVTWWKKPGLTEKKEKNVWGKE